MDKNMYEVVVTKKNGGRSKLVVNAANRQHAIDKVNKLLKDGLSITDISKM